MNIKVKKNILQIKPYVPGRPIEEVQRELGLKDVIKLASNESPFGPSPKVIKAIEKAARSINRYPDSDCFYLRKALAKHLGVRENQLFFSNGSDEIIVLAIKAFTSPGDEVVMAEPSFLIYEIATKIAGAQPVSVPLQGFRYDLKAMKKAVTKKTKMIFIGNPDNPAGTYVTEKQVRDFLKGIPKDILVFFDEAYFEFVLYKDYPDTLQLMKKFKNIMTTRTFSKMYGLAGLRIGYGIGNKEIIDVLNRIREPFNVNCMAQAAAMAALKDLSYYRRIAKKIEEQRKFLYKSLAKMDVAFVKTVTNFILVDVNRDSREVTKKLLKEGIIIRDMQHWRLKTFIRVTIGSPKENRKFIKALREIL